MKPISKPWNLALLCLVAFVLPDAGGNGYAKESNQPVVQLIRRAASRSGDSIVVLEWCPMISSRTFSTNSDGIFDGYIPAQIDENDFAEEVTTSVKSAEILAHYAASGRRFVFKSDESSTVAYAIRPNLFADSRWPLNREFVEKDTTLTLSQVYDLLTTKYDMYHSDTSKQAFCNSQDMLDQVVWVPDAKPRNIRHLIGRIAAQFVKPGNVMEVRSVTGFCASPGVEPPDTKPSWTTHIPQ